MKRKTRRKARPVKKKSVDQGLLGAAQSGLRKIRQGVSNSRKALETDPMKAISEAVLQNLRLMRSFAALGKKKKTAKAPSVRKSKRRVRSKS